MRIIWRAYSTQKFGNFIEENDDAFWPVWVGRKLLYSQRFTCALSDGATQASFSSLWAQLLVRACSKLHNQVSVKRMKKTIQDAQRIWQKEVDGYSLPWHAQEKVREGAHATLLHICLWGTHDHGIWRAFGIGDTCLFLVRNQKLVTAFPLGRSQDFNNTPALIVTKPARNQWIWTHYPHHTCRGTWQRGDNLFLMSDALSEWFLVNIEQGVNPIDKLAKAGLDKTSVPRAYEAWVQNLRQDHLIHNDDTSMIWLTLT